MNILMTILTFLEDQSRFLGGGQCYKDYKPVFPADAEWSLCQRVQLLCWHWHGPQALVSIYLLCYLKVLM